MKFKSLALASLLLPFSALSADCYFLEVENSKQEIQKVSCDLLNKNEANKEVNISLAGFEPGDTATKYGKGILVGAKGEELYFHGEKKNTFKIDNLNFTGDYSITFYLGVKVGDKKFHLFSEDGEIASFKRDHYTIRIADFKRDFSKISTYNRDGAVNEYMLKVKKGTARLFLNKTFLSSVSLGNNSPLTNITLSGLTNKDRLLGVKVKS